MIGGRRVGKTKFDGGTCTNWSRIRVLSRSVNKTAYNRLTLLLIIY
jgi:hypothetical protein